MWAIKKPTFKIGGTFLKKGFIKKQISNQYTIIDLESHKEFIASARGKLRYVKLESESSFNRQKTMKTKIEKTIAQISPKVGDHVIYDDLEGHTYIEEVLPRKNDLERPDVANVDQVLLIFSAIRPDFSFLLLDKFLIIMHQQQLTPVIVISKIDLIDPTVLEKLKHDLTYYEKMGYKIYYVNSKERIGIDVMKDIFKDKITVLAGQTGVGKSTLLNAFMPDLGLKTQEISDALGRGKHTTRHTELYEYEGGYIVDTPGFSKIEFQIFDERELKDYYEDFMVLSNNCKFMNKCLHVSEPHCAVKHAYESKTMISSRYENYLVFYDEIKNQKEKY